MEGARPLNIVKYNKKIQNRLNLSINDYKECCKIEIELIPIPNSRGTFININENDEEYYHIYFNDNKEEIKRKDKNIIKTKDKVTKIKVIIDYQVQSFRDLFSFVFIIKEINFKKFYRTNNNDL